MVGPATQFNLTSRYCTKLTKIDARAQARAPNFTVAREGGGGIFRRPIPETSRLCVADTSMKNVQISFYPFQSTLGTTGTRMIVVFFFLLTFDRFF